MDAVDRQHQVLDSTGPRRVAAEEVVGLGAEHDHVWAKSRSIGAAALHDVNEPSLVLVPEGANLRLFASVLAIPEPARFVVVHLGADLRAERARVWVAHVQAAEVLVFADPWLIFRVNGRLQRDAERDPVALVFEAGDQGAQHVAVPGEDAVAGVCAVYRILAERGQRRGLRPAAGVVVLDGDRDHHPLGVDALQESQVFFGHLAFEDDRRLSLVPQARVRADRDAAEVAWLGPPAAHPHAGDAGAGHRHDQRW